MGWAGEVRGSSHELAAKVFKGILPHFFNIEGVTNLQNPNRIISTVLGWDNSDFRDLATKIERNQDGPSKAHLEAIKLHVAKSPTEHENLRILSMEESKSAVTVIFETVYPPLSTLS